MAKMPSPDVAADGHGGLCAEVDGRDLRGDLHERDAEHLDADPHDVAGVAGDDAVVDDVGVHGGQVEHGQRGDELEEHDQRDRLPVRP
nr:hypothetical protein GCM10020092_023950 [Actinoplanes digitatis]